MTDPKITLEFTTEEPQPQEEYDLFNNPMVKSAMKSMTPEQIEHYKKIGESMYSSIDFEDSKILNNMPPPMAEALAYVVCGVKSGLHPQFLNEDEIKLLAEGYGEKWYEQFGYTEEDLS